MPRRPTTPPAICSSCSRCKLDLCARLGVFELEAGTEGHHATATLFHDLAAVERDSFERLKRRLIAEMEAAAPADRQVPTTEGFVP